MSNAAPPAIFRFSDAAGEALDAGRLSLDSISDAPPSPRYVKTILAALKRHGAH